MYVTMLPSPRPSRLNSLPDIVACMAEASTATGTTYGGNSCRWPSVKGSLPLSRTTWKVEELAPSFIETELFTRVTRPSGAAVHSSSAVSLNLEMRLLSMATGSVMPTFFMALSRERSRVIVSLSSGTFPLSSASTALLSMDRTWVACSTERVERFR